MLRQMGEKPPRYDWALKGPGPKFWDYARERCRRPGPDRLRRLMRVAEVALNIRALGLITCLVCLIIAAILGIH